MELFIRGLFINLPINLELIFLHSSVLLLVLSSGNRTETNFTEEALAKCGLYYCPDVKNATNETESVNGTDAEVENNFKTDLSQIYTLAGVYLGCSIASAIVIALLLDPLTR